MQLDWIAGRGSAQDLVSQGELPDDFGYYSSNPVRMLTAHGESSSTKQGKVFVPRLGKTIDPYLVKSTPAVLSVGMRCIDDGYDFVWNGSRGEDPYFVKPDGKIIPLTVNDYVPYLAAKPGGSVAAPVKRVARREAVSSPEVGRPF